MIRYLVNREKKEIELLSGGTILELEDLVKIFKEYTFKIGIVENSKAGMTVGANYVPTIGKIEHN